MVDDYSSKAMPLISVIIVTHNSQQVLPACLSALILQGIPMEIILVDSGSKDTSYIDQLSEEKDLTVFKTNNVGFSRANNIGYLQIKTKTNYVLFLNPDVFLSDTTTLAGAIDFMEQQSDTTIGCISGRLIGFDNEAGTPTGYVDSAGILRKWYGRWYDRGQGQPNSGQYTDLEDVPAVCGAFMFCRRSVLEQISLAGGNIFDPDFFLYKEDIELCLRMWNSGWRVVYYPKIEPYHCRGWQDRRTVPYHLRLVAATSELLLYKKHPSPYLFWAFFKYLLVRCLKI